MTRRGSTTLLAAFAAAALLAAPVASAGTTPEEPPTPTVLEPSAEELAKIQAALGRAAKDKDVELLGSCLIEMEKLEHESFIPAIRKGLKSKDDRIKRFAILAAATHELRDESKAILKLVKGKPKKARKRKGSSAGATRAVATAAIDYLARLEISGAEKNVFQAYLKTIYLDESRMRAGWAPERARAAIHYLGKMKYKPAVKWFIEQLPEPRPANINAGNNPPASYWEARYKIWQKAEGWIRWALKEITGKEYRTHREWKAWYSANEKQFK